MLRRLMSWWCRRKAAKFSYCGHSYQPNMWVCTLCRENIHVTALGSHARIAHGFRGEIECSQRLTFGERVMTEAERESVRADLRSLRGGKP